MSDLRKHVAGLAGFMKTYKGRLTFDSNFGVTLSNNAYMVRGLDEIEEEMKRHLEQPIDADPLQPKPFFGG